MNEAIKEFRESAGWGIFVIINVFTVVLSALLAGRGLEDPNLLDKFTFFHAIAIGFLLGFIFLEVLRWFGKKQIKSQIPSPTPIHDPEEAPIALTGKIPRIIKSPFAFFILCGIIFVSFGLLGNFFKLTLTGFPVFEQQVTATAKIVTAVEPATSSENHAILFPIILFILYPLRFLFNYFKLSLGTYHFVSVIGFTIGVAFLGWAYHLFRYGFNEIAVINVITFWALLGLMTILTYSLIPAWWFHASSNFYQQAREILPPDTLLFWSIVYVIISIIILIIYLRVADRFSKILKRKRLSFFG